MSLLESPGPVFFRQERVGKGREPFRITKLGAWMRRRSIDELPQLLKLTVRTAELVLQGRGAY